ncbi:tRNA 2-selenouridine(34) synthase MnmH [Thiomicrospira pelophila]|uniref:tRNA 2-selenouridine(34) synthase MnmH n=1 Tax=Thiomicrospira pelophila TaxID=934 RepID=UPI0004A6A9CA|nr:tRNA 2-selenouridine(34) synthase MnmH [Thiomicrospira pelophila]
MSNELPTTDDFRSILLNQTPLIDVRAPTEFSKGAIPNALNLPLMQDDERQQVGLCYKEQGQQKAIELGHQLVNETVRAPRIQAWCEFKRQHPQALIYCFRGGLRSRISQQWMMQAGFEIIRIKGGYKAFRHYLMQSLDEMAVKLQSGQRKPWVLAGRTGSGKTQVLNSVDFEVDLEGLAQHRGSTFGRHAWSQPSQIDFENQLAYRMIELDAQSQPNWLFEDEARNIGSVHLNQSLYAAIKSGDRILLDTPFEQRRQNILTEYVLEAQTEYVDLAAWVDYMQSRFERIAKRLGGVGYARVRQSFDQAWLWQQRTGDPIKHLDWIDQLLTDYYDPMYDYQLKRYPQPIVMQGHAADVTTFLQNL